MQKWIKGEERANKELLACLLDTFAGKDLEEQREWDGRCVIVDCSKCGGPGKGEWTDTESDLSI